MGGEEAVVGNQWEMKTNCLLLLQLLLLLLRRWLLLLHTTTRTTVPQSKVPVFAFNLAVVAVAVDTLFWETTFVFFPFPPPCDRPKFDPGNWRSRHDETSASFFYHSRGFSPWHYSVFPALLWLGNESAYKSEGGAAVG